MAPSAVELKVLKDLITSTLALLKQFSTSITNCETSNSTRTSADAPHPLQILRDSAKLIKAHTTKLSLIAINKPFTLSAITKILRELAGTCLPASMSAAQICTAEKSVWGETMNKEVTSRVRRIFREMENLLQELLSIAAGNGQGATNARDSLASTGVVWESCDAVIELEKMGVAGLVVQKAEQYRDTIKDAIAELVEWKEGTDTEFEGQGDELLGSDDEGVDGDADSLDDIFNAANSMPKDRPELKVLVEEAEGKLKKVVFLYTALVKRRFKTFSVESGKVDVLDEVLVHLVQVQSDIDDLASCFYELDEEGAKEGLKKCVEEAKLASDLARLDWTGKEDEFTIWSKKWEEAVS